MVYPDNPRYRRIRSISNLMDRSIVLPTGYRIGLDPLLGLVPGVGDAIGTLISCYLVYEAARLGVTKRVLFWMLVNIAVEGLAGSIPVLGDLFDAAWKANVRNLRLLDQQYHPGMKERSAGQLVFWMMAVAGGMLLATGTAFYLMFQVWAAVFRFLFPGLGN